MVMDGNIGADHPFPLRHHWMSVLARSPSGHIETFLREYGQIPPYKLIRGPEVGLMMVRGRVGGTGAAFNLGEMTVTRCTVRTESGHLGHAYVAGRHERRAELAALVDAFMQDDVRAPAVRATVIDPLASMQSDIRAERSRRAAATQVQFFAMQAMRT
jgi:alpha-D-ribose 1-methylphosphonate 5-triphosphate synthase subunit PhnG